jgi:hypothetical protein
MKDKLAEEIIKQFVVEVEGLGSIEYVSHELAIHCMQAYHEAKMRESKIIESMMGYSRSSMIAAAKAMRNGEIKHNREV